MSNVWVRLCVCVDSCFYPSRKQYIVLVLNLAASCCTCFREGATGAAQTPTARFLANRWLCGVLQTAGGVYLPDSKIGKTNEGEVIAVGPGRMTEAGTKIAVSVTVGDKVLLPEYGGTTLTLGDEELSLFRDEDILGKFQVRLTFQTPRSVKRPCL